MRRCLFASGVFMLKNLLTLLFWGTITVYGLSHFVIWAFPFLASPFVTLLTLLAIMAGASRSSSK
jgi:hypothetical protein